MKFHNSIFTFKKSFFLISLILSLFSSIRFYGQTTLTFTVSGTFTVPCGVTSITVQCWGGGGGGAGDGTDNASSSGFGGGGGGYVTNILSVTAGSTITYTVGTGGVAGALNGGNGGNTIFSSITANGGTGGTTTAVGTGGSGSGGTVTNGSNGASPSGLNGGNGGNGGNSAGSLGSGGSGDGAAGGNAIGIGGGGGGSGDRSGGAEDGGAGFRGQINVLFNGPNAGTDQTLASCVTTATLAANSPAGVGSTGTWTCISGCTGVTFSNANSPTSTVSGLTPGTNSTLQWTWTGGGVGCTSINDQVVINTTQGTGCWAYCIPTSTSASTYPISNVTFAGINNTTSAAVTAGPFYENFSNISGNVVTGNTFTISVTATGVAGNTFGVYVFFDWNNDGDFTNDGGPITLGTYTTASATLTGNITVPNNAVIGTTRMRIANQFNVVPGPCPSGTGSFQDEDYSIVITAPLTCSGTPSPGNLTASSSISCAPAGISSVVTLATTLTQSGYTYQWQSSTTEDGVYSNISGETNDSIFILLPSVDMYYRLAVTCTNGNLTANTNTTVVSFCPPSCNDYIQNGTETGVDCGGSCPACTVPANDCANHPLLISRCSQNFSITQAQMAAATADAACTAGGSCQIVAGVYTNFDCDNTVVPGGASGDDWSGSVENSLFWTFTPTTSCSYNISITATNCCCKTSGASDALQYYVYRTSDRLPTGTILQYYGGNTGFVGTQTLNIISTAYQPILIAIDGFNDSDCDVAVQITAGAGCNCSIAPLPIELLSFYAKKQNKDVKISWTTVSEVNNSHFNLMRLNEKTSNWEKIAKLNGKGNSNALQYYNFVDTDVEAKTYYYQLEQVNFDGNISRSKIISINNTLSQEAEFKLIPNPVESEKSCQVILNTLPEKELTIQVIDINGVVKYESKLFPENSTIEIPTNFTSGIYLVKLSCNEFTQTKRLMVK